jgi:ribosomal protein S18 acetylase RimI-like enzyme
MKITQPKTKEEFNRYFEIRWRILRKPWNQPRGSEKDELESESTHVMAVEEGSVIGVARGHFNCPDEAQIRYMAVEEGWQNRGVGSKIILELERILADKGAKSIVLNARESAVEFYKKHGYRVIGESHTLFGAIPHKKMAKSITNPSE